MDKKSAKKILHEHKDALEVLLESEGLGDVEAEIKEATESAKEGAKALKKSLLERVKDFPIVDKISQLGTAGTVAVSTAAVTQADLAKDLTEVFVAEIANDVVEQRFEVPDLFNNFVDFHELNDWGQQVISEKVAEAQSLVVSDVSPEPTPEKTVSSPDPKPASVASSEDKSDDTDDDKPKSIEEQKPEEKESKEEEKESPSEKEVQKESEEVKPKTSLPVVKTPIEDIEDPIKPHDMVTVSPVR